MSDLVGNPEDRFSRVAAHLAVHKVHYSGACVCVVVFFPINILHTIKGS